MQLKRLSKIWGVGMKWSGPETSGASYKNGASFRWLHRTVVARPVPSEGHSSFICGGCWHYILQMELYESACCRVLSPKTTIGNARAEQSWPGSCHWRFSLSRDKECLKSGWSRKRGTPLHPSPVQGKHLTPGNLQLARPYLSQPPQTTCDLECCHEKGKLENRLDAIHPVSILTT